MEDLQTSETACIHAKDNFRAINIGKVHVISTWLQVADKHTVFPHKASYTSPAPKCGVVTKMRFSAGGRLTVNGIQLRIHLYMYV